ncbi:hypothetical protein FSP39_013196 [Pinctada imbricata]|uniref:Mitochondrial splicing suppressor 51-like C-terminal domain-containing protein n=1 Tax=Pinctada imbricata TaxID=66713 RepID=A0AA88YEN2_PINIB|nr:hypothetical protein FSP39_013196 [Pinctada imbricata]
MYMQIESQLAHFPFLFMPDQIPYSLSEGNYREFLRHYDVEGKGLWKWELPNETTPTNMGYDRREESYILPEECLILETEVTAEGSFKVTDWESYYKYRGFDMSSPIALLLHWPLTLWYIIQHCIKQDYNIVWKKPEIDIHIIGVEKEVMLMSVFQELGNLLPENLINITMYGRNFPKKLNGEARMFGNVCVQVCRKLYHKVNQTSEPDLVIGFNAGIAAYSSWLDTLKKIQTMKCPAYFTDCCQLTIDISKQIVLDRLNIYFSDCKINPFRSPLKKSSPDDRLSRYSNAFVFHMLRLNVQTGIT